MFAPTKVWRSWHRHVNQNQRRYATVSALAASALPALVTARGHAIDRVHEVPCVVEDSLHGLSQTKAALAALAALRADDDVARVENTRSMRAGKGKMRGRRWRQRRGPLVVHAGDDESPIARAFSNVPGVEVCHVDRMNLLQLAPGGHLGRFIIWTQSAFARLDALYGTASTASELKSGYRLPRHKMANSDLSRIINSDEIQSRLRSQKRQQLHGIRKKNPLKNLGAMLKLNPYAAAARRAESAKGAASKGALKGAARKGVRAQKRQIFAGFSA